MRDQNKKRVYGLLLLVVVGVALGIRVNNLFTYNSWWADDGGGHIIYIETLINEDRLPTMDETYLAWHEPGYYYLIAQWHKGGEILNICEARDDISIGENQCWLNWWESVNIIFYVGFLLLVWLLTFQLSKNRWLALLNVFLASILFTGVKLSAYVTNETLNQTLILLLIYLFIRLNLFENHKWGQVFVWALILGVAGLIKLTSIIILIGALICWIGFSIIKRKGYVLGYALLVVVVAVSINAPWLFYKKEVYGSAFTINAYEEMPKQDIFTSAAWRYLITPTSYIFFNTPFWVLDADSFIGIAFADVFGDHYNIFNNVDRIGSLEKSEQIGLDGGRYTTQPLWDAMMRVNRIGLIVSAFWTIGFLGFVFGIVRKNKKKGILGKIKEVIKKHTSPFDSAQDGLSVTKKWYEVFLLIAFIGGWAALFYNVARLPYLHRGVLKVHFIWYTFPLLMMVSYKWWWEKIKNKFIFSILIVLPIIIYLVVAMPVLWVN